MIQEKGLINELHHLVADMNTSNTDMVVSIFGEERSGKSTFAINLAKVLDPTFNAQTLAKRTALTFGDFIKIGSHGQPYQVVWADEIGFFTKRSTYSGPNIALLNFFQQAGGSKRIFLLCFPELGEIDKKVVQRSRLFFETTRKNGKFYVKGWTKDQIRRKIRESRLFAAKSRAACWAGSSRVATKIFQCDYRGIESEMEAYGKLKELNLERTDAQLRSHYKVNLAELCVLSKYEITKATSLDYSRTQIYRLVRAGLDSELAAGNVPEYAVQETPRDIFITDPELADKIVQNVLGTVLQKYENKASVASLTPNPKKIQTEA